MNRMGRVGTAGYARGTAAAVLLAGFAATLAVNLPGQLSYDSVAQLLEGRTGHYNSWHPPVMAWLLGLFDAVVPGSALFVIFQVALVFGTLLSLLWLNRRTSWWAIIAVVFCVLTPQLLLYPGIVWKDVLFAAASVAGFAALAHAAAQWQRPRWRLRWRLALIALAFALFALAAMTRQNGVLVPLCGAATLAVLAWKFRSGKILPYALWPFLATLLLAVGGTLALTARGDGGAGARAELAMLQIYDMTGMLHAQPTLSLNLIDRHDPALERAMRGDGERLYTSVRNDTLTTSPALQSAVGAAPAGLIFAQWRALIGRHPLLYLKMRARLFTWVFFTPHIVACLPAYIGIDGPPPELRALGLTARIRPRDKMLFAYVTRFEGTPILSHAAFALAGIAVLCILLWRRRPADLVMGFLLLAALGFAASFFFISVACDYRYLYFLDLSVLAVVLHLACDPGNADTAER